MEQPEKETEYDRSHALCIRLTHGVESIMERYTFLVPPLQIFGCPFCGVRAEHPVGPVKDGAWVVCTACNLTFPLRDLVP